MRSISFPCLRAGILFAALMAGLEAPSAQEGTPPAVAPEPDLAGLAPVAAVSAPVGLAAEATRELDRARAFVKLLQQTDTHMAAADRDEKEAAGAALNQTALLEQELRTRPAGSVEVDRLYERIVADLQDARLRLHQALDVLRAPAGVPRFEPSLDPATLRGTEAAAEGAALEQVEAQIAGEETRLKRRVADQRWEVVDLRAEPVERLNALRIQCLAILSPRGRAEILGMGRAGVAQLHREIDQLTLSLRLFMVRRVRNIRVVPQLLRDIFAVGEATYTFLKILAILMVFHYLRRRGAAFLLAIRRVLFREARGIRWTRRVEAALGAVAILAPWSTFLVMVRALRWAAGDAFAWPEVTVAYRIAILYGFYRLAIDALVGLVVSAARRYRLSLDEARTNLLIGSIRSVLRVLAGITAVLVLSEQILGRGALYHMVVALSWFLILAAVLRVLAGWREIIADAYLKVGPDGRLAMLVRSTRDNWYGVFVAAASFLWLAGRAGLTLARDFAFGFDQTRRALAFLFRRRMERHAERQGYAPGVVSSLAPRIVQAFSEAPVSEGPLAVNHFTGLDRLGAATEAWTTGAAGGAFLVVGEPGIGKTSWLGRVRAGDAPIVRVSLERRVTTPAGLAAIMAPLMEGPPGTGDDLGRLRPALAGGPPRVIVVDRLENLFLARVGGYDAFGSFMSLIEATCRKVFWVCALDQFAYEHLEAIRPDIAVYRAIHLLPAWNESLIHDLIRARMAASGTEPTYEDLVVDRMEGLSIDTRLLESEEGYIRLLWDYSDGNPAVALHFWLRSLVQESPERVRVRLFRSPPPEALENGRDEGRFILAAVVVHGGLTAADAAAATGYPEGLCRIYMNRLRDLGALSVHGDIHRVSTHWQRAAIRLLKRKNLLAD